jgi:integrase
MTWTLPRDIRIRESKGGKASSIPMNDAARAHLEVQPLTESPYVFPGRGGGRLQNIQPSLHRIRDRAGLPKDFRCLHGLRHVYASMLASSGKVDLYTLQKLLTHKSPAMTQRYAHLRDEALKRAADVAGDLFNEAAEDAAVRSAVAVNGANNVVRLKK